MFQEGLTTVSAELETAGVTAVVVTYRPEADNLRRMLLALAPQVRAICVVDNSDDGHSQILSDAIGGLGAHQIRLGRNCGIGYAQNVGIGWAMDHGATHVLLMDQDSVPAADMVAQLMAALGRCDAPAVVGPSYRDPRNGHVDAFVRIEGLRRRKIECTSAHSLVEVDALIASGCLIPVTVLRTVGLMRAELFIDYVDIEWGLRARKLGVRSYGVFAARMDHTLGDRRIQFGRRRVLAHSPIRHYYQVRNTVWFLKQSTASTAWRILDVKRLLQMFAVYSVARAPRLAHTKMMGIGLWHGLFGRTGSYEQACASSSSSSWRPVGRSR